MKGVVDEVANLLKQRVCASHDEARPKVAYCKSIFAAERTSSLRASLEWVAEQADGRRALCQPLASPTAPSLM